MNKMLIAFIVVVLVAGGIFFYLNAQNRQTMQEVSTLQETATTEEQSMEGSDTNMNVQEFTITARDYSFNPSEIRVKKGDTVRIIFSVEDGRHDWVIDGLNLRTRMLGPEETETVEFVADQAGTFEYYCSVPGHRQLGMVGNLIVTE